MSEDPKPVGELGAAFAALSADLPPASFSAADVIARAEAAGADQASPTTAPRVRRNWIIGTAAALAGVAVITTLAVNGLGGNNATTASATSSAASSSSAASLAPAPLLSSTAGAAGGAASDVQPAPSPAGSAAGADGAGTLASGASSSGASSSATSASSASGTASIAMAPGETGSAAPSTAGEATGCAAIPLSAEQGAVISANVSGLTEVPTDPSGCDLTADLAAVGTFSAPAAGDGAGLIVEIHTPATACTGCSPVPGHDGVQSVAYGAGFLRVFASGGDSSVVLVATPVTGATAPAFSIDELAAAAAALAATL